MVVVIGASTALMGIAMALIHSTFDVERSLRRQLVVLAFAPKPAGDGPPEPSPSRLRVTTLLGHAARHSDRPATLPVLGEKP